MKTTLLFRLGGLGDLLAAFPSIHYLRRSFPSLHLTLVCRAEYGRFLQETGVVDRVVSADEARFSGLFEGSAGDEEMESWLSSFHLVLGWMQSERGRPLERRMRSLGIEKSRFFIYDLKEQKPVDRFFFEKTVEFLGERQGRPFGFEECGRIPLIGILKDKLEKFAVIHPGSGSEKKCWPLENFMNILRRVSQEGCGGVLVTGEAEERLIPEIQASVLPSGWSWLHSPPLADLAGRLHAAAFFLGNDSGVTRLAAACGTKTVALFRKEFAFAWRPAGRVFLLSADHPSQIRTDSVWTVIRRILIREFGKMNGRISPSSG
ncbi:MAG: glycosyltransferase family 9 protein [Candidatus Aminicenantales bacterium]